MTAPSPADLPAPSPPPASEPALVALRRQARVALATIVLMGGTATAWAVFASVGGAVLAPGVLVVESNTKRVQHPAGGVVGALHVREGERVRAGDLLVSLDDTVTRANLAIITNELTAMQARAARLRAERDGLADLVPAADLARRMEADAEVAQLVAGERRLLQARAAMRQGQKAQLRERIAQLGLERDGLIATHAALENQLRIARGELEDMEGLLRKSLIQRPRVTQIQREVVRIEGGLGDATARIAQAAARVAEAELQVLQLDRDAMGENAREMRETETRIVELTERRVAAEDALRRIDLRSPQDGTVHQLAAHTVGGVIAAGETVMQIVPLSDSLVVEARIAPSDIDQIRPDQAATLRFTAFSARTTPELRGRLTRISPDLARDAITGQTYYTATLVLDAGGLNRLGGLQLIPGMPVEAHLATSERTVASFLTKPLTDQFRRALREE